LLLSQLADRVQERRLQPREREVEPRYARDGEVVGTRISFSRQHVDLAPARVAEPEQARALVERLACGVVERRPEQLLLGVRADVEQHRVTAARQQAEEGWLERLRLEVARGDVAVEVVDGYERQPARPRDRFCCGEADEERADQPG